MPSPLNSPDEYKSKTEEAYVIESIATVGEIAKHLPWSKYNSTLQSLLGNLSRYPDQERFLVAMLCSIIDAFHFTVETGEEKKGIEKGDSTPQGNGVSLTQSKYGHRVFYCEF